MSKVCEECGYQMDDNALECPNCGCPVENEKAYVNVDNSVTNQEKETSERVSGNVDSEVLNYGKSTEAESVITYCADLILKWGNILAKYIPVIMIVCAVFYIILAFVLNIYEILSGVIGCVLGAIFGPAFIRFIAKLTWASIMLFVNISTTLKRIENKMDQNGTC